MCLCIETMFYIGVTFTVSLCHGSCDDVAADAALHCDTVSVHGDRIKGALCNQVAVDISLCIL